MSRSWALTALCLSACGAAPHSAPKPVQVPLEPAVAPDTPAQTHWVDQAQPTLIKDATLLTAEDAQPRIERGWLRLAGGLIEALGAGDAPAPREGERVVEAAGRVVTPGLIDTHSHLGVYPTPYVWAHADGNEMTAPVTAGVRAIDAVWPQDPGFQRAVQGGVTTLQVLPGSGNLMGGQGVVLKLHPSREARAMRFPGAPAALKMACGENPKRIYGKDKHTMPMSRMGSIFLARKKWIAARRYQNEWARWRANPTEEKGGATVPKLPPKRDLELETLAGALAGEINVHVHCYRADEMLLQLSLADEFGFKIRAFHHAVEAYKIRDVLAARGVAVSTWADWWGFKIEAYDAIEQNLALLTEEGVVATLHTDSAEGIQRMNQEAAKAYYAGLHAGVQLTEHQALKWLTANGAWVLGVQDRTGSLKAGKMADVVIWDRSPFSVYAKTQQVFVDGVVRYDSAAPQAPWSDFEVGQ